MTSSSIIESVDDQNFEKLLKESSIPVMVDFWANWCGPCKMLAPTLEAIADKYNGKLKIVKLDVAANQVTPTKYNIRHIPALLLFKNNELIANKIGGELSQDDLEKLIDSNI